MRLCWTVSNLLGATPNRMGYLTLDEAPDTTTCRALFVPNSPDAIAIVRGALQELIFPYNWTPFGALSPEESAAVFIDMFDKFSFNQGSCRLIGEIIAWAGIVSPNPNWLPCDGSLVAEADYPDLFVVIGDTYGSSGSSFRLPNLLGRSPVGVGSADSGMADYPLGAEYGTSEVTLTEAQIPAHSHTADAHFPVPTLIGEIPATTDGVVSSITGSTGGGEAHSNLPPRLAIHYLIVAKDG